MSNISRHLIGFLSYLKGLNSDWSTIKTYWACSVKLISCQDTHFNALLNINTFSFHIEFRIFKGQKSLNIYARRNHKLFGCSRGTIRQFQTQQVKWFPAYALNLWFFFTHFHFRQIVGGLQYRASICTSNDLYIIVTMRRNCGHFNGNIK